MLAPIVVASGPAGVGKSEDAMDGAIATCDGGRHRPPVDPWLDELDATHGAPSAKSMAAAREWLASGRKVEPRAVAGRPAPAKAPRKVQRAAG